jgi:hypothetical protein
MMEERSSIKEAVTCVAQKITFLIPSEFFLASDDSTALLPDLSAFPPLLLTSCAPPPLQVSVRYTPRTSLAP